MKIYVVTDLWQWNDEPAVTTKVFKTREQAAEHCEREIADWEENNDYDPTCNKDDDCGEYYRSDVDGIRFEKLQIEEFDV